ncbi:MAG: VanW family protein [Solirubrobacteraceae bacterium]|nr:VanW family protein [Solirubrobacteraceae bacterium]
MIRVGAGVGLIVALWLVATIGVRAAYAGRILPGTTMGGVDLGSRSDESARRAVSRALASQRPVTLTAAGRRFVVRPAAVGYSVDVAASVARARDAGRHSTLPAFASTITALIAPRDVEPVFRADRGRLAKQVAVIARAIDRPARAGTIRVDRNAPGRISVTAPRAERRVQRAAAAEVLLSALQRGSPGPVELPVRRQREPTLDEVQVVARRARAYLREPLQLAVGARTLTPTTRQTAMILALRQAQDDPTGALVLGVDPAALDRFVDRLAHDHDRPSMDARIGAPARPSVAVESQGDISWRPRRADVSLRSGRAGRRLQRADAVSALSDAVRRGRHRVSLSFTPLPARITTSAARAVTRLLGTFTTRYPCCQPRVTNIRLIAKTIDGTVVMPGETFSLNQRSGERTRAGGYVKAPFIADGELAESVGGGVSQFSTTLYNAVYFAGLRIDAHQPHSFYIDRYPPGREATLNFPDIDLRWTNDTSAPVLIRSATDETSVVVSLYGTDTGRRVRAQTGRRMPVQDGDFAITVTRVLRFRDGKVDRQAYTTRYDRPPPPD